MCAIALRSEVFGRSTSASPCPVPRRLRPPWSSAPPVPGRFSPRPLWHSLPLWRSHRASSCTRPPWSSATSVLDRSALSFLRLVVLAPGRVCALALSLPSARPSPAISRAAVQSPLPWRLHPCNKFIHACIDSLILSLIHSSTQLFTHSITRSSIYVPFTSADD